MVFFSSITVGSSNIWQIFGHVLDYRRREPQSSTKTIFNFNLTGSAKSHLSYMTVEKKRSKHFERFIYFYAVGNELYHLKNLLFFIKHLLWIILFFFFFSSSSSSFSFFKSFICPVFFRFFSWILLFSWKDKNKTFPQT